MTSTCARALGNLGPDAIEGVSGLTEALKDPDMAVRREADEALRRIDGK